MKMAYDFSKNRVSVTELSQKRADAVANSRSSNKSSSTPAATPTATQSDTWNKDTVTLEEARQQTEDVRRGVINPNTGSTSLELSESKETISLEQAQQQTKTEVRPATDMRATKTTEYVNDAGDVVATKVENTAYVPIKVGSNVRQSDETVTTVTRSGNVAFIEQVDNPNVSKLPLPVATVPEIPSSNSIRDAALNLNASVDKDIVMRDMGGSGTISYMELSTEQRKAIQQEGIWDTVKIDTTDYKTQDSYTKSQGYAARVVTKGDNLVGKLIDADVKITKKLHINDNIAKTGVSSASVKNFVSGAVVDNAAGVVAGLGSVPIVVEAAVKEPVKTGVALGIGAGILVKDVGTNLSTPETRARTAGQLVGAIVGQKVAMNGFKSLPRVTLASEPQGFLLKKSGVAMAKEPPIINDVPLIEAPGGISAPDVKIFTKPNKAGTADVFFKLNPEQAGQVAKQYTGNIRNIRTPEGSFIEFEPTGTIKTQKVSRTGLKGLTTQTPQLIGAAGNIKSSRGLRSPVRLEARENIQPASIRASNIPERLQIPDFTYDLEATARPVKDTLALRSGRVNFWESEAGQVLTKENKKTVVNDMPWMKERVARVKAEVTVKEPFKSPIDFKPEFERLYKNAGRPPGKASRQTVEASLIKDTPSTRHTPKGALLGLGGLDRPTVGPAANPLTFPNTQANPLSSMNPSPYPASYTKPNIKPNPRAMPLSFPETVSGPDPVKYSADPIVSNRFVNARRGKNSSQNPIVSPMEKKRSSKKGKKSKSEWKYDRLYNQYGDINKWRGF